VQTAGSEVNPEQGGDAEFVVPLVRECPFKPPARYKGARENAQAVKVSLATDKEAWALFHHEDVKALLTDSRFSSNRADPRFPELIVPAANHKGVVNQIIAMDEPEHGIARRAILSEFTVKNIAKLRDAIQHSVDHVLDRMLSSDGPVDLVRDYAQPVSALVICTLLGVPEGDFEQLSALMLTMQTFSSSVEEQLGSFEEMMIYLDGLVVLKEQDPPDDLLGRQIQKLTSNGTYSHDDLVAMSFLLVLAGYEGTVSMIALGVALLLDRRDQLDIIMADPEKIPGAVEELLRYLSILDVATARMAKEDVEIGGVQVRAGEGVIGLTLSANHDPSAFDRPDEFDVLRNARGHLAFGFGRHQCLGQNLARLELQIAIASIFRRIPGITLTTGVDELRFKDGSAVYGLLALPVSW
jgi:cytochrome P450